MKAAVMVKHTMGYLKEKDMNKNIIWKPIAGFEKSYLISNTGLVKGLERRIPHGVKGYTRIQKERYLKPALNGYGYLFVVLSIEGKHFNKRVHQLVADAFIKKCSDGMQVNHKDGIKTNNLPENLEYVTPKENTLHSIDVLGHYRHGKYHWKAKLTEEQVKEMRVLYKTGRYTQVELAKKYNIHRGQLSKICNYTSWI